MSLVARYRPDGMTVMCTAPEATALTLAVSGPVSSVELNGRVLAARDVRADATRQTVTIELPAGRHQLRIGVTAKQPSTSAGVGR
jgi:hypothetical protein